MDVAPQVHFPRHRLRRHRSEQNLTSFQLAAHFFRHVNFNPHEAQVFVGNLDFLIIFGTICGSLSGQFERIYRRS
jgi:hypothetical protein